MEPQSENWWGWGTGIVCGCVSLWGVDEAVRRSVTDEVWGQSVRRSGHGKLDGIYGMGEQIGGHSCRRRYVVSRSW